MTELTEWFVYLLPLNLAATWTLLALAKYIYAIVPPSNIIKANGIEVSAMSMKDALRIWEFTQKTMEQHKT